MKKLRIEELAIESFPTESVPEARGTVEGHYGTAPKKSFGYSCDGTTGCGTCAHELTCGGGETCTGVTSDATC